MSDGYDSIDHYAKKISTYARIDHKREAELSRRIRSARDSRKVEAAVEELVLANLRLVVHCLKEFRSALKSPSASLTEMDLIAEGNIALMCAARGFDAHHTSGGGANGASICFSSYACRCIKRRMRRALRESRLIHIPERHFNYWTEIEAMRSEGGGAPSDEAILDELEISPEVLGLLRQSAQRHVCRLEDMLGDEDGEGKWEDVIADDRSICPSEMAARNDSRRLLQKELSRLPARTRHVVESLFLNDEWPTLAELAERLGISSERVRQVCADGLQRLRRQMSTRAEHFLPSGLRKAQNAAA